MSPSDLLSGTNPCAIDLRSLTRKLRRAVRTAAIDDSVRFGIVASCGSKDVVIQLPYPENVNLERLRKTKPDLARWWDLQPAILERAFGTGQIFNDFSAEREYDLEREGETVVPELLSGRFDAGLQPDCPRARDCPSHTFRDELRGYVRLGAAKGYEPSLRLGGECRLTHYVPPRYPPLAIKARISGTVKLDLTVDPDSGAVRDVQILAGHPLFRSAVVEAARQWRFAPGQSSDNPRMIPAELVFEWHCPNSPERLQRAALSSAL